MVWQKNYTLFVWKIKLLIFVFVLVKQIPHHFSSVLFTLNCACVNCCFLTFPVKLLAVSGCKFHTILSVLRFVGGNKMTKNESLRVLVFSNSKKNSKIKDSFMSKCNKCFWDVLNSLFIVFAAAIFSSLLLLWVKRPFSKPPPPPIFRQVSILTFCSLLKA